MTAAASSQPKPGIVWVASYPKSGNTWTRSFLHNIAKMISGEEDVQDINQMDRFSTSDIRKQDYADVLGFEPGDEDRDRIAAARHQVQQRIVDAHDGLVFVKTHQALVVDRGFPTINFSVTSGAIYIVRNPLDVAISYAHHLGRSIDDAITAMGADSAETAVSGNTVHEVYGSWSQHVMSWTHKSHPTIYVLQYEHMLAEPHEAFGGLVRHLLLDVTPAQIARAIERSSFSELKAQEEQQGFVERPRTDSTFFREGRADQWKDVLTPQQIDRVVNDHWDQMAKFGYLPDT